ncbi:hypothetical protein KIN20_015697 [Parelaphostrongylus tenuis]|uniref:Uncharacterized protein n=1 Tax=Parelaphostrongylus tenuis TaxID=148309 RepID=A0AAD5MFB7_PARTN|nr:hypothetical protein KIN20_015695 [Parelaphostrongylus tenuis]KAJ1357527.1 hypothetical protein KIN20_015697 [Parelaphostrongylus tenuis]
MQLNTVAPKCEQRQMTDMKEDSFGSECVVFEKQSTNMNRRVHADEMYAHAERPNR